MAINKLDDPRVAKKTHFILAIVWFALAFPIMIWLNSSLPLLVFISVYAIVAGHWSGWDAAGGELEMEKLHKKVDDLAKAVEDLSKKR